MNKVFLVLSLVVTFYLALLFPSVAQASAASGAENWYLTSQSPASPVDYKGHLVMQGSQAGLAGDEISVPGNNGALLWLADRQAQSDVAFPGEGATWSLSLHTSGDWSGSCSVSVGQWHPVNDLFKAFATSRTIISHTGSETWIILVQLDASPVVPAGHFLGLEIVNSSGSPGVIIGDAGSYLVSPDSDPGYPLPEKSSAILFALGLCGLAGFVFLRRKAA